LRSLQHSTVAGVKRIRAPELVPLMETKKCIQERDVKTFQKERYSEDRYDDRKIILKLIVGIDCDDVDFTQLA